MVRTEQTPEFFQSVVKYGSDLITIINTEGLYTYVSDSITRVLGYSVNEMVGTSPFAHIHEDDLAMALSYFEAISTIDQAKLPYFRYRHKDGSWRWLDCTATNMICDSNINGYVTNSRDITEKVEATQKRKESQAYYEALYVNHPDLVFTLDKQGVILDCNANVSKIAGYSASEIIGRAFTTFVPANELTNTHTAFTRALTGKAHTISTSIISKTQEIKELNVTVVPVIINDQVSAIQCIAIDITEKKRAEEQLKEQTNQLNNILGSITEAFFALDNNYCFTYFNKAFSDYVNVETKSLKGKNLWEEFPLMQQTLLYSKCQEVSGSGQGLECEEYISHINSVISWKIYPFENGIAVCFTDVSAKQKALEEQKNLSLVASKTTNGVLITDLNGKIDWVNNSFELLTGFSLSEIFGKDPADFLYGPETQQDMIEHIRRMLQLCLPFSAEFINHKKTGEPIWVALDITPILDEQGTLLKFINIYTDVTDRKQAEIRLLQLSDNLYKQNRDLQQFTYIVSHNLRAPVANLVGLAKMLQKLDVNSPQYNTALTNLDKSAIRLDTVIKDLNKILSVKSGKQEGLLEGETDSIDVSEVITEVVQSLQEMITGANAEIKLSLAEDVYLETKRAYIYSIIHNLLTNAIKYRSEERPLLISLESVEVNNQVVISIKDNGSGMDMDKVKPNLFKLYKRFHNHVEGKGLGLYLVKSQVEALNGRIEVDSAVGIGTEFKVFFKYLQYD